MACLFGPPGVAGSITTDEKVQHSKAENYDDRGDRKQKNIGISAMGDLASRSEQDYERQAEDCDDS